MWEYGNVMLGFDVEERMIQKLPVRGERIDTEAPAPASPPPSGASVLQNTADASPRSAAA
jgi:hypothetical protein